MRLLFEFEVFFLTTAYLQMKSDKMSRMLCDV